MASQPNLTRRRLLKSIGLGSAAFLLKDVLFPRRARADSGSPPRILIFCYFSGGWDQLYGLDPRPYSFGSTDPAMFPNTGSVIDPGWDAVVDPRNDVDSFGNASAINYWFSSAAGQSSNGLVSMQGTNLMLGPAFYDTVAAKNSAVARSLCVVRGINMGTLTHEVGRRYFITGKFPRGLTAAGSSLPTWVAYQNGAQTGSPIPNLAVSVETYNEALPAFASGLSINVASDLQNVLQPLGPAMAAPASAQPAIAQAVSDFEAQDDCWEVELNGQGSVDTYRASRLNALSMVQSNLAGLFSFYATNSNPLVQQLFTGFGLDTTSPLFNGQLSGAIGQALIAAQAITPQPVKSGGSTVMRSVSNCVSIQLASGIDTHDTTWTTVQGNAQRQGFDALGRLINYLQQTADPLVSGHSLWDRTQIMGFSEFTRTPAINARGGRDHHLSSSCFLAGQGIKGGQIIGGTSNDQFLAMPIDLNTGSSNGGNYTVRPPDIHATFLHAAGLDYSNLFNQQPVIIPAILSSPS